MALMDTPRNRRLHSDLKAMKEMREQSSIVDFTSHGDPPERYLITFRGKGLVRKSESDPVDVAEVHRVEIRLGIDYPRSRPDLQWLTSIYHPNISGVGAVCLGGYSTNWVPSLQLAELCEMLWDMIRYANYDPKSAYNYASARWSETQTSHIFPLDKRFLRDKIRKIQGDNIIRFKTPQKSKSKSKDKKEKEPAGQAPPIARPQPQEEDVMIIDDSTPTPNLYSAPSSDDEDILIIE